MPTVLINCRDDELNRERLGFYSALKRAADVIVAPVGRLTTSEIELADGSVLSIAQVSALFHLDPPTTPIPHGLPSRNLMTVWVHMDGATAVTWRSSWLRLFDIAVVCGAAATGYNSRAYRLVVQPYGAQREWFSAADCTRDLQIAWAGSAAGAIYAERRRLLPLLAARYRMNDWRETVSEDAVVPLYRRAQAVVNIQRDDCRSAYNLRCFEAFAAGALLFVEENSRIDAAGFRSGIHYVGYSSDAELFAKLDYYLKDESARAAIARAGQTLAQERHTYDHRLGELFDALEEARAAKSIHKTRLSAGQKNFLYCHYYGKRLDLKAAGSDLRALVRSYSPWALPALLHFARARWHVSKRQILRRASRDNVTRVAGLETVS